MSVLQITFDHQGLRETFAKAPQVLIKHIDRAVLRTVQEIAREARQRAPEAYGTLRNSIKTRHPQDLVGEVVTGTDYARMVEEGTDSGGFPPEQTMLDWIKRKGITPDDPRMDQEDLAYVLARAIALNGTPAQPFMQPALESKRARADQLIDQAIGRAVREIAA